MARVALPVRPANGHRLAVETELVPLELPYPAPPARRSRVSPLLLLTLVQVLTTGLLVWIELAQPPPRSGLLGFYFSNVLNSDGARAAMRLYRDRLGWLPLVGPDHVLSATPYLWSLRAGLLILMATQVAAVWVVLREDRPSLRRWAIGPMLSMLVLLIYPPINTDVFYYASVGRVANEGGNPYLTSPLSFGPNAFDRYSDWEHITAPYGPIWTVMSQAITAVTGTSPFSTSLGFKVFAGVTALALAFVTARLAKRLTGDHRFEVLAFVLVAWSPLVLYESAGTAHFEPLLMLFALCGLLVLVSHGRGRIRSGLLLITASALCKPVTLPLLGSAALVRLARRREPLQRIAQRWIIDGVAVLLFIVALYAQYWAGGKLPEALYDNSRELYVERPLRANPFWIWLFPRLGIDGSWLPGDGPKIVQSMASLLILASVVWLIRRELRLRKQPGERDPSSTSLLRSQIRIWAIVMFALAYLPPNAHAWYMIWALPLVALIAIDSGFFSQIRGLATTNGHNGHVQSIDRRLKWLIVAYFVWTSASFFIYHTWTWG